MENVGDIQYTVDANTASLLQADKQVATSTANMQRSFDRTDASSRKLNTSLSALGVTIAGLITASALKNLASLVQNYEEMSDRLKLVTSSSSEFEHVNKRLLASANATYRSLSETQELYIRTAAGLKSMSYSTDAAIDITDSMAAAFVLNATSADRANASISAFSKIINTGKVSADAYETVVSSIPSIIEDIAKATGRTAADVRALGSAGKLTAKDLTEGLRQALASNSEAAAGMSNNLKDAAVRVNTSVTAIAVAFENQTGALQKFTQAIIDTADGILNFSQDSEAMGKAINAVGTTAGIVAAIIAARYVGAITTATAVNIKNAASALQAASAQTAMATAARAGSAALALIGGPAGAAMLAATAVFYFWEKSRQAREEALALADNLDGLTLKMKEMSAVQVAASVAKLEQSIVAQKDAIADLRKEEERLLQKKTWIEQAAGYRGAAAVAKDLDNVNQELAISTGKIDDAERKLSQTYSTIGILQAQANGTRREGIDLLGREATQAGSVTNMMYGLGNALNFATGEQQKFNAASLGVQRSEEGDKLLAQINERNSLLKITDKRERAVAEAALAAEKAGVDAHSNQMRQIKEAAAAQYDLQNAERAAADATKSSASEADHAADALASQAAQLARLNTGYAEGSVELAKYDAVLALGANATAAQRAEAEKQATAIHAVTSAIKANEDAEKNRIKVAEDFASLQQSLSPVLAVDTQYQQQMAMLDEYVTLYPQKIAEAEAARAAIEDQYHQQRLSAMWEEWAQMSEINAMTASIVDNLQGGATNAITGLINGTQSLAESFANIGTTILNSVVGSVVQMGIEWVKSYLMQETAAASAQATAAAGLAASTAAGLAQAAALSAAYAPAAMAASIASYGAAATTGQAAYTAAMATSRIAALEKGGPASAGQLYRVGERGPEIFSSGGKNYMIPGQSGSVTPNREIAGTGGSGGVVQTNSFTINTTGGIDDETLAKLTSMMKQVSQNTIVDNQRPGGLLQKSR